MSDRRRCQPHPTRGRSLSSAPPSRHGGQALAEYVLILALVAIALIAVLTITGPAVGNVFSNAVYNLLGGTVVPRETLQADDFWTQVAAVASYTPENPLSITNTPGGVPEETEEPIVTPEPTDDPEASETPEPTDDPEVTETPEATEEPVETPEPPPTPDQEFGYPFNDPANDSDRWEHDFTDLLGSWDAEFWNWSSPTLSDMSSMPPGSGIWQTTFDTLDHSWSGSPGGGVASNFYARFTTTENLLNEVYTLRLRKDDGMRVWVGGTLVFDGWSWDNANWREVTFTPSAGPNEVVVELFDSGSTAVASVFINRLLDTGTCNWALSDEAAYSAPTAWSDSPGTNYAQNSTCYLRLRGTIDLTDAVTPKLQFYDRYALGSYAYARVGVSVADSGAWTDVQVHSGSATNLGWTRQVYDLSNFGGQDFTNQVIEVRFALVSGSSTTSDGWWIDDITVEGGKIYTVGFSDNMEGPSHWYPEGTWARTNEQVHSPGNAWSDSPGEMYTPNTNYTLELDGKIVLDNAVLEGDPVAEPEMVFWHRYELQRTYLYAEISRDERQTWERLTGTHLAYSSSNLAYTQVVIPLDAYIGDSFYFRFRLQVRSDASLRDGWYIDDFALRNRDNGLLHLNWCDDVDGGGATWLPSGSWAVINGVDENAGQGQSTTAFSGSQFFSDSPGANYQHLTNSTLALVPRLNLTSATHPLLTFWHQWDVEDDERLLVEVSDDLGATWDPVWTKNQDARLPDYGSTTQPSGYHDHIRSWTREAVDLSAYTGTELMLRFRLDALSNSDVDDGWWLDNICVEERNEPVYSLPFTEGFESGISRWYLGGNWARENTIARSGGFSAHDSPSGEYQHESNGVLELRGAIDLTTAVKPTLYIWNRFELAESNDSIAVEVRGSSDGGVTWSKWEQLTRLPGSTVTTSWNREQIGTTANLGAYAGQLVKLRFRVYAERDSRTADGWYIDDIAVIERNGTEPLFALPYSDDAEAVSDDWVFDGTWGRVSMARTVSTSGLGPGAWEALYCRDNGSVQGDFDAGDTCNSPVASAMIDFNWGSGSGPAGVGLDDFLARWTRTINVVDDGTIYEIHTRSDDRIRVLVDGDLIINAWENRGYNDSNPEIETVELDAGAHVIVVEFYESGGDARVRADFGVATQVFHDSPDGDYMHRSNASMTMEGMVDLTSATAPYLSFWTKRQLGSGEYGRIEISTDEGHTWIQRSYVSGSSSNWEKLYYNLSGYAGQKINIRFRLDARSNSGVGDGWYIDDIQVYDS